MADETLAAMDQDFAKLYSPIPRQSMQTSRNENSLTSGRESIFREIP
jgi:hypothetical protein